MCSNCACSASGEAGYGRANDPTSHEQHYFTKFMNDTPWLATHICACSLLCLHSNSTCNGQV